MSWRPQPKGSRKPEKRRFQNKGLCFFAPFSGVPLSGKQCLCGHKWHKGGLLGLAPNPYLRANMARSVSVALLLVFITLTLLFLLSSRFGVAHQSVNVRFDRDDLLHIPSCLLIFSIELFFLCCELTAFFLQHIHFGSFALPSRERISACAARYSSRSASCPQNFRLYFVALYCSKTGRVLAY